MFCLSLTLLLIIESVFDELVSVNLHSLLLLNRVSLYSFPLSYNLPEGFSFRSLRYMIFYFLKELFASLSQIRFIILELLHSLTFHFLSARIALASLLCYSLSFVCFLFCFRQIRSDFLSLFSLSVSAFSFLRFGSAKVETFFLFPKLFFLFFILSFDRFSFSFLFLRGGLQRYKPF
jgi:hypothetical protein